MVRFAWRDGAKIEDGDEAHRRLQYWGGQVAEKTNVLVSEPLPQFLVEYPALVQRIAATGAFANSKHGKPNHCLVNEYEPGQGIMPHNDGSAYFPAVATLSLGSAILLDIFEYQDESTPTTPAFSILQEPRSLLITHGSAYQQYLHGIAARDLDTAEDLNKVINRDMLTNPELRTALHLQRDRRLSMTFRDVERVAPRLF
ncbi:hypothetical protein MYAM1_000376 [Malassezia yamatoensis]|uniref:Fe2OG dioxygenase domain-containing protein n=1 Tax=Malassezia yamatoensis TaxID=253288 RepID=A0AAJ5YU66_9BASI|nr:hypothetical protein MYAM1_000376 [Malassezia yamatoensis]